MNCFAIWYKHKPSTPKERLKVILHLNLWKLKVKKAKSHRHFLDIGIRIDDLSNIATINIYSPIKIKHDEIQDLGKYFQGNRLVAAIFNEDWSVKPLAQSKILQVEDENNSIQFYIYMIDVKNDVTIHPRYRGSIISLKVRSEANIKPVYYRIRIISEKLEGLSTFDKPESQWLESHFTNTELVDFRINEKRNLDKSLLEEMHRDGEVHFESVDLFIMREFTYDYIFSHEDRIRSRRLEKDLWDSYVDTDCECDNILAYHWKFPPGVPSFNAFVKYKFVTSDWPTRITFIFLLLLIAVIGAILGALFYGLF